MVTYEHVNELVRNRCVKLKAKRQDSRATLLLIATSVGALIILIIKQTNTNIVNQTNKPNKEKCTHCIQLQYIFDHSRVSI